MIQRGDVHWVSFGQAQGGEIQKRRPCIIISNDSSNEFLNRVQVVPATSNISNVYPCEALVVIQGKKAKAMADQLTTVSKDRLGDSLGKLTPTDLSAVERAITVQLGLQK